MQYYSTNSKHDFVSLRDAIMRSMAHDGGVYMPESIPLIPRALFKNIADMSLTDIAYVAGTVLFGSDIPPAHINDIVKQTLNFPIPLVRVTPRIFALELYHGPTGSFKDVGARFLARLIKHYISGSQSGKVNVLVATSGDTGCAVAQGFAGIDNINVFILHPKGRLLRVPSDQFLSPAPNIIPISVRGTFDECQELVRQAYTDEELNRRLILTSANSVNIARLLPQTFYLFHAYARLLQHDENIKNISLAMPCGNLGNLTAALFALSMGLPVNKILAAGRGADRLWGQMQSEHLDVNDFNKRSLATNLARINCLIKEKPSLAEVIDCHTYNDEQISRQILSTYRESGYLMDRNTAMACHALTDSLPDDSTGVFLATAHPAKYHDRLREILGNDAEIPQWKAETGYSRKKHHPGIIIPPLYPALRNHLLDINIHH